MTDIEKQNVRKNFKNLLAFDLIFLDQTQQDWILDYLTSGKGIIPYQMITSLDSLKIAPKDGDFLEKEDFYSTLKENISDQEHSDVKIFFKLMRMKTFVEMNKIYNIQDTLILWEIFEQGLSCFRNCLNSILESAIAQALFLDVSKEIRVNVILCFLQTLKQLKFLKKH